MKSNNKPWLQYGLLAVIGFAIGMAVPGGLTALWLAVAVGAGSFLASTFPVKKSDDAVVAFFTNQRNHTEFLGYGLPICLGLLVSLLW